MEIRYGQGISKAASIINVGVMMDIIKKSGSWFSYNDTRIGQGKENVKKYLEDNPEIAEEITAKIYAAINDKKSDEEDGQTKAPEEQ